MKEVVHNVDLGRVDEYCDPCCNSSKGPKKNKKKKSYPGSYMSNIENLPAIPRKGLITFEYEIRDINLGVNDEGKTRNSLDLRLKKLVSTQSTVEKESGEEDPVEKMFDAIQKKLSNEELEEEDDDTEDEEDKD